MELGKLLRIFSKKSKTHADWAKFVATASEHFYLLVRLAQEVKAGNNDEIAHYLAEIERYDPWD